MRPVTALFRPSDFGLPSAFGDSAFGFRVIFSFVLTAALLLAGCSRSKPEPPAPAAPAETHEESRVKHGTNGEVIITLDAATQKVMGLQTAALAPANLAPELKAYGRVLDASPLAVLVADLAAARASGEASQADLKRLQTLTAQNNASERALQAAEAAAARDRSQAESVRLRLLSNWGAAIAGRPDLAAFAQSLASQESALVQIGLPAGASGLTTPAGARLVTLANGGGVITAQFLGAAPMVDAQTQGRGFLFLVAPNPAGLAPGASVTGFLSLPGEAQTGVAVPRDAVLRHNGATWVYLQTGEATFQRVEVALERPLDTGWFVRENLKPQDRLVTVGAQQFLSEELKGQSE